MQAVRPRPKRVVATVPTLAADALREAAAAGAQRAAAPAKGAGGTAPPSVGAPPALGGPQPRGLRFTPPSRVPRRRARSADLSAQPSALSDELLWRGPGSQLRPQPPMRAVEQDAWGWPGALPAEAAGVLDAATLQLERLVEETHQALVRDGLVQVGDRPSSFAAPSIPSLDAVDRALEELQRGLAEIDSAIARGGSSGAA